MSLVFSTFPSSAVNLHWQPQPTPAPQPASVSLIRCQAARKGVRIVPVEYRESTGRRAEDQEAGPVASGAPGQSLAVPVASAAGGGRRRSAASGGRRLSTLISAKAQYQYNLIVYNIRNNICKF
jgi:hypothetical protein